MSSIVYNGHTFAPYTTAEATLAPAVARVRALEAPGAPSLPVVSIGPREREVVVRLFLDLDEAADAERLGEIRREMSGWLAPARGASLVLPGLFGYALRDAVPTAATGWDGLFREDGSCTVTFTAYDPRVWGTSMSLVGEKGSSEVRVEREGTAPVPPTVSFTADAGEGCSVALYANSVQVMVRRAFAGGEQVEVDCELERVSVDGRPADADVAYGSAFFDLPAGSPVLTVTGGHDPKVRYREAWL